MKQKIVFILSIIFVLTGCGSGLFGNSGPSRSECYGAGRPGCLEKYGPVETVIVKARQSRK